MTLPAWVRELLEPMPGELYVIRKERPDRYGRIHIPEGIVKLRRSAEATVTRSSSPLFPAGQRVLVAQGVSRRLEFDDHVTLYIASEPEILGTLEDDSGAEVDYPTEHPLDSEAHDDAIDEGAGHTPASR